MSQDLKGLRSFDSRQHARLYVYIINTCNIKFQESFKEFLFGINLNCKRNIWFDWKFNSKAPKQHPAL